jgi:hypothetical protein
MKSENYNVGVAQKLFPLPPPNYLFCNTYRSRNPIQAFVARYYYCYYYRVKGSSCTPPFCSWSRCHRTEFCPVCNLRIPSEWLARKLGSKRDEYLHHSQLSLHTGKSIFFYCCVVAVYARAVWLCTSSSYCLQYLMFPQVFAPLRSNSLSFVGNVPTTRQS